MAGMIYFASRWGKVTRLTLGGLTVARQEQKIGAGELIISSEIQQRLQSRNPVELKEEAD